jgi:hypothetical protein
VAAGAAGDRAEASFRYLGPTADVAALGSGAVRRQLGLKLRAESGCNLVYAMWRLEPKNEIVVSVKSNPGQRTHAECGNRGYANVAPEVSAAPPEVRAGEDHTLTAAIDRDVLAVRVDGKEVWRGRLPASATTMHGPPGIRTDNVRVELAFTPRSTQSACTAIAEDE